MSALGHTMASISPSGGKPGPNAGGSGSGSGGARVRQGGSGNSGGGAGGGGGRRSGKTGGGGGHGRPRPAPSDKASGPTDDAAGRPQNINHLLSFTLPERVAPPSSHLPARRQRRGGASYAPFNKERYVNAQYRFLVKPTGDYTAHFADSDIFIHWSNILTVLIPTTSALATASHSFHSQQPHREAHEGTTCPICLSEPTAPRMTKCGHVFCYPCILHYLMVHDAPAASGSSTPTPGYYHVPGAAPRSSASGAANSGAGDLSPAPVRKWKRCPVCWDAVYASDLKAVEWWDPKAHANEYEAESSSGDAGQFPSSNASGDVLRMRLIERPHLTTLALPKSSTWPLASTSTSEQPLIAQHSAPWHFQPDVMTFCKFMLATPDQLFANLDRNLRDLEEERSLLSSFMTKDEVGLLFVDMAERKVHEQMGKVSNELDTQVVRSRIGYAKKELAEHYEMEQGNKARDEEAVSRRQRKRLEREREREREEDPRPNEAEEEGSGSGQKEGKVLDGEDKESDVRKRDMEGAQEFLSVQAQRQGGVQVDVKKKPGAAIDVLGSSPSEGRSQTTRTRRNLNPPAPSSSSFFFYQVATGQNIFLHPLDIKIVLTAYGSYSAFPTTLHAIVQGADEGSMNEDMKKRCKYLTHLTMGADVVFIEVNWEKMAHEAEARGEEPPVGRNVLRMYDQALRQRRNRRRDKERREDRAKSRYEEQERISRPPMTSSTRSIGGFAGAARSPDLSATDIFPSSLGSHQSALSPRVQEALLQSTEGEGVDDFPAAAGTFNADGGVGAHVSAGSPSGESALSVSSSGRPTAMHSSSNGNAALLSRSARTVWGMPAAKATGFATALHNSSRTQQGYGDDDAPDWDAWLEIEEDFILGGRNDKTVREGRGLNRQNKGASGQVGQARSPPKAQHQGKGPEARPPASAAEGDAADKPAGGDEATPSTVGVPGSGGGVGGKQQQKQKKKKLVLTSGGGGRGAR